MFVDMVRFLKFRNKTMKTAVAECFRSRASISRLKRLEVECLFACRNRDRVMNNLQQWKRSR